MNLHSIFQSPSGQQTYVVDVSTGVVTRVPQWNPKTGNLTVADEDRTSAYVVTLLNNDVGRTTLKTLQKKFKAVKFVKMYRGFGKFKHAKAAHATHFDVYRRSRYSRYLTRY